MATVTKQRAPATKKVAQPFTLLHFERWAECLILDTEQPWHLEPFQRDFIKDLFEFRVSWAIWPEGNTKTTTLSGVGLYHIQHKAAGYVAVAASSRDQAEWLYRQAESFVVQSELEDLTRSTAQRSNETGRFRLLEGYRRIRHDATNARMQIFAADDRGGDGAIATLYLIDELHRHRNLALYRTWMGKVKKRHGNLAVISTAGEVGSEFEEERTKFRQHGKSTRKGSRLRVVLNNAVMHEWALQEGESPEDMKAVKRCNPFSGISEDDLAEKRELPGMSAGHWARFSCNRASRAENSAIAEADWTSARVDEVIPEGEPVGAGLDVGWKWDTTALVPLWMPEPGYRLFGPANILTPPRDGSSLDPEKLRTALLELNERNPIHTLVMDMSRAEDIAGWAASEFPDCLIVDRSQQNAYAVAEYDSFMKGLREQAIKHMGDPGLTRHVMNAVARILPGGDSRFDRPNPSRGAGAVNNVQEVRVIDALKAASMVHVTLAPVDEAEESLPMVALI